MFPLALGLSLDIYLIGNLIIGSPAVDVLVAAAVLGIYFLLWIALPRWEARRPR